MIPLQLRLTNFLSYRDTVTIDLTEVHLAVISGDNGAGKSTLLDAMTWTLFGKSRSRSDDDLVNRQAAQSGAAAEVAFTFDMEGAIYRVVRSKQPNKTTNLELQVAQGDLSDPKWLSLTEGKLRETQSAVERVLRMNYDVFTNASFFLQGQADEFTTKTPNQRKEILAEVLGVTQWEAYREKAAELRKQTNLQLAIQERQLEEIGAELAEATARKDALAQAEQRVSDIRERLQVQQQLQDQVAKNRAAADRQMDQVAAMASNLEQLRADLSRTEDNLARQQQELDRHLSLLEDAEGIRKRHESWQEAAAQLSHWQALRESYLVLQQERQPYDREIVSEESRLRQELADLSAREQSISEAAVRRKQLVDQQEVLRKQREDVEQTIAQLRVQLEEKRTVEKALDELLADRRLWQQEQAQLQSRFNEVTRRLQDRAVVEANIAASRHDLERKEASLATAEARVVEARNVVLEQQALESAQERLKADMDRLHQRIKQLQEDAGSTCPLCGQELTEAHRDEVILELQADGKGRGDDFRANKDRLGQLKQRAAELLGTESRKEALSKEIDGLRLRLTAAELSLEEIKRLVAEWEAGGEPERLEELTSALADSAGIDEKRAQLAKLEPATQAAAKAEADLQSLRTAETQLASQLEQLDTAVDTWQETGAPRLLAVRSALENASFASEARAALADLDQQVAELGFDPAAFQVAQTTEEELSSARDAYQALKQAEAAVSPVRQVVADLQERRDRELKQVASQQTQHDAASTTLAELQAAAANWRSVEEETMRLQTELSQADQQLGASRQRVLVLGEREKQATALRKESDVLNLRMQRLRRLEEACGRKGVQALLIEHALPEIEEHANSLLDRLTGGDMRVTFDTQRQLKSRDETAETLDIRIRDSFGERPYENYSGGEQFRVDFAIRLALSQLLAQRAGAKLRTLIIDEGFGSQDPQGRQRLIEAINTVQSDFDCILVITHIAELRDAFPARIVVEKGERGSTVQVNVL